MSIWFKGNLIANLATERDTGGAFEFVVTKVKKGTEPPPHAHEREHEMSYVLEGVIDVYVGDESFRAIAGECVLLPKRKAPAFSILRGSHAGVHDATDATPLDYESALPD